MKTLSKTATHLLQNANKLRITYEASLGSLDAQPRLSHVTPVFPVGVKGTVSEEQYIKRMIERDRKLNWG